MIGWTWLNSDREKTITKNYQESEHKIIEIIIAPSISKKYFSKSQAHFQGQGHWTAGKLGCKKLIPLFFFSFKNYFDANRWGKVA